MAVPVTMCLHFWSAFQITSDCLILRRFPDEKISARLWNDRISVISNNDRRATVTIHYRDNGGECKHHFHSKEVNSKSQSYVLSLSLSPSLPPSPSLPLPPSPSLSLPPSSSACFFLLAVSESLRISSNFGVSGNNFKLTQLYMCSNFHFVYHDQM